MHSRLLKEQKEEIMQALIIVFQCSLLPAWYEKTDEMHLNGEKVGG